MNVFNKISVAALLVCSASCPTAYSQVASSTSSPSDAWYFMPSATALTPDTAFGIDGRGHGLGLTFGKAVSQDWDIQIGTRYAHQHDDGLAYQQNTLGVDGLYMFNRDNFRPFFLIGAGYQQDRLSSSDGEISGYAPFIEAGLGARISLDKRWSFQVDFRREQGFLKNDAFNTDRNRNNYVSVGLSVAFD